MMPTSPAALTWLQFPVQVEAPWLPSSPAQPGTGRAKTLAAEGCRLVEDLATEVPRCNDDVWAPLLVHFSP